jgi:MFS family permease
VVQSLLLWRIINFFGDTAVIIGSLVISAAGLFLMMQATSVAGLWLYTAVFSAGNTCLRPAITTLITKNTRAGQGASMGLLQSYDSLGRIVGPVLGGWAYEINGNAPFIAAGSLLVITLLLLRPLLPRYEAAPSPEPVETQVDIRD